jgi:threonine dehydrogenase-like Zn-dependent dehydrogenase
VQALVVSDGRVEFVPDYPEPEGSPEEVVIRVHLAGICATDLEIARGYMQFVGVLGHEFVGSVVRGPQVLVGRRVVAEINCPCGQCELCQRGLSNHCPRRTVLGIAGRDGAFAEYLTVPASNCHLVPETVSDRQAVFVEPLAAAVHVLAAHPIDRQTRVTLLGTGRLGLLVAQVLALQNCEFEVVGRNPHTLAFCRQRGMRTIHVDELSPGNQYDVVVDCTGSPDGLRLALSLCRPCGTIVLKSTYADPASLDLAPVVVNELRVVGSRCGPFAAALRLLADRQVEVDELISGVYPLARGIEALEAAARPEMIKVLLRPGSA